VFAVKNLGVQFQYGQKRFLWHFHASYLAHALLTFLLLFQQLTLTGDVTTITLGSNVFAQGADGFAGDDFRANGGL